MPAELRTEDRAQGPGGPVRLLTLSNPARKNAVDAGVLGRLVDELARAAGDRVRALVLTGEGGVFCAGYDLNSLPEGAGARGATELPDAALVRACNALESCRIPVIAAIDGPAFGAGVELACACDLRVASNSARFCLPPAKLGLVYSPEGTSRVLRLVGIAQARRLFFTAAVIESEEALRIGLCQELTALPSALPRALDLAQHLAQLSPGSLSGMKRTFALLAPALAPEARAELDVLRRDAFASDDAREGTAAFLERRAPVFGGK